METFWCVCCVLRSAFHTRHMLVFMPFISMEHCPEHFTPHIKPSWHEVCVSAIVFQWYIAHKPIRTMQKTQLKLYLQIAAQIWAVTAQSFSGLRVAPSQGHGGVKRGATYPLTWHSFPNINTSFAPWVKNCIAGAWAGQAWCGRTNLVFMPS